MPDRPTELLFDGVNSSIGCGEQLSRGTGRRARLLLLPRVWSDSEAKLLREDVLRNVRRVGSMSSSGRFAECTLQEDSNADQLAIGLEARTAIGAQQRQPQPIASTRGLVPVSVQTTWRA
jgi:hypothetical protein